MEWEARNIPIFQGRGMWYVSNLDLLVVWDVATILSCRFYNICPVVMLVAGNEND